MPDKTACPLFTAGRRLLLAPPVAGLFSRTKRSSLPTGRGAGKGAWPYERLCAADLASSVRAEICALLHTVPPAAATDAAGRAASPAARRPVCCGAARFPAKNIRLRADIILSLASGPKEYGKEIQKVRLYPAHTLPGGYINGQRKTLFRPASAPSALESPAGRAAPRSLMSQACSMREYGKIAFMAGLPQEGAAPAGRGSETAQKQRGMPLKQHKTRPAPAFSAGLALQTEIGAAACAFYSFKQHAVIIQAFCPPARGTAPEGFPLWRLRAARRKAAAQCALHPSSRCGCPEKAPRIYCVSPSCR